MQLKEDFQHIKAFIFNLGGLEQISKLMNKQENNILAYTY